MKKQKKNATILVGEDVYISKKGTSDKYSYYFRYAGVVFRKTTKTADRNKASQIALAAYHDAIDRKKSGKLVQKISFKQLSQKYIAGLKGQNKVKFHEENLKRHFADFFNKFDDISKINAATLNDYLTYRKEKSDYKVLPQSLNKENVVFNQMMALALENEWLSKAHKIKRQSESQTQNRRADFKHDEYNHLLAVSRKRAHEFGSKKLSDKERGRMTARHWNRNLLHDIILIMANSGMRVDEMKTVTWRDIDWKNKTITLNKAGKVKSSRVVLVRGHGIRAAERIKERRLEYIKEHNLEALKDSERIQSLPNSTFVFSLRKGFNELLKACGFEYKDIKDKHSLTSLRHTYATLRLTATRGQRASMRALAKQLGTSTKMVESNYGHDVVEDYRDELMG